MSAAANILSVTAGDSGAVQSRSKDWSYTHWATNEQVPVTGLSMVDGRGRKPDLQNNLLGKKRASRCAKKTQERPSTYMENATVVCRTQFSSNTT